MVLEPDVQFSHMVVPTSDVCVNHSYDPGSSQGARFFPEVHNVSDLEVVVGGVPLGLVGCNHQG